MYINLYIWSRLVTDVHQPLHLIKVGDWCTSTSTSDLGWWLMYNINLYIWSRLVTDVHQPLHLIKANKQSGQPTLWPHQNHPTHTCIEYCPDPTAPTQPWWCNHCGVTCVLYWLPVVQMQSNKPVGSTDSDVLKNHPKNGQTTHLMQICKATICVQTRCWRWQGMQG